MECLNSYIIDIGVAPAWIILGISWGIYSYIRNLRHVLIIHHIISTLIGLKIVYIITFCACLISSDNTTLDVLEIVFNGFIFVLCESYIVSMFGILNIGISLVIINSTRCLLVVSAGFFSLNYAVWIIFWILPYEGCFVMVFYLFLGNFFIRKQNSIIAETIKYTNSILYYRKMSIVKSLVSLWNLYYIVANIYFICYAILIEMEYSRFTIQLGYKVSQVLIVFYTAFLFRPGPNRGFIDDFNEKELNENIMQVLQATISNESAPFEEYCLVLKPDTSQTIKSSLIATTLI
jgi:hypothetical protein